MKLIDLVKGFVRNDEGQDLIEYALLVGLISLAAVFALTATGTSITNVFNAIQVKLASAS